MTGLCRCGCRREAGRRRGLADSCYQRWLYLGRPAVLPPPRWAWGGGVREGRIEDYAELRERETREMAAARLGVSLKTAGRYDAALRASAVTTAA